MSCHTANGFQWCWQANLRAPSPTVRRLLPPPPPPTEETLPKCFYVIHESRIHGFACSNVLIPKLGEVGEEIPEDREVMRKQIELYRVFSAKVDWTLTHMSRKDTEYSFYHTRWRNTDWLTDQVIIEWMTFILPGDTIVCRQDVLDV
jgi:hypothetical protein